jgi:ABC-type branched-subunit amino acid transport system ATPase component
MSAAAPILVLERVRKAFGGLVAVDDLGFAIAPGEIFGLIGPNGSGKTTALNLISGALKIDAGIIRFKDRDIANLPAHVVARCGMARTFQLVRVLSGMTAVENVIAGMAFREQSMWGRAAEREAAVLLARVGLADRGRESIGRLTYIDQKRLELARALALDPALILLDEWLAGLNPTELHDGIELIRSLRDEGRTIIMVEHVMDAIRSLCDRCVVMSAGRKIAEDQPEVALARREVIEAYLGELDA